MNGLKRTLGLIGLASGVSLLGPMARAEFPTAVNRVEDQAHLLPKDDAAGGWKAEALKLKEFEARTGIRIVVQFHAKSPPEAEDKIPGAYMSALSTQLGLIEHGILVVYFADDPDWRIWFGNQVAPAFVGQAGTAAELTKSGAIHASKEAFLDACEKKTDALLKATKEKAGADAHAVAEGLVIAEGLMNRLGPKP